MGFPFPSQIDFRTSILALDAGYGLREVPSYSLKLTRYGRLCKASPRHLYYRRGLALQILPPRAA
jgi:hypothetical protein